MKIAVVIILIYAITTSWCQDEKVFHCSPKPGCDIARCDPVAVGWDRPGFNIDEHLRDMEFPISCKSNSTVLSWLDLASRNLDITNIRMGLNKLENKFDEKIGIFGKKNVENDKCCKQINQQSTAINNLSKKAMKQFTEIKQLKKELAQVEEINKNLIEDNNELKRGEIKLLGLNAYMLFY
ncbi:uncharacterized protein LOC120325799 [Styela clava]